MAVLRGIGEEISVNWKPGVVDAATYDRLILDVAMREYFGPSGYYNAGYWAEGASSPEEASRALTDRMIRELPQDLDSVADIGCGLGATTQRLTQSRPRSTVFAVNFSRLQLDACRVRCPDAILVHADAVQTGLLGSALSAVLCIEAALHFNTRVDFFHEAFRILQPGGTLAMTDVLFAEQGWPGSWTVPAGNFMANPEAYCSALTSAGFEHIRIEDALEECWGGFCRELESWSRATVSGTMEADQLQAHVSALRSGTTHYLLVSAKKRSIPS
jgi:SAM-dependent methyltransferase